MKPMRWLIRATFGSSRCLAGSRPRTWGTTFKKTIQRAGVDEWPKPFQNLRASRQTKRERHFPTHVVCAWKGNTPRFAHKHYLTLTEDDFDAAVASETGDQRGTQPPAECRNDAQTKLALSRKSRNTRVSLKLSASWKMPELCEPRGLRTR